MTLGEALKSKREELGVSINRAAMKLEVTRPTYDAWEHDYHTPRPDKWEDVGRYLGKSRVEIAILLCAVSEEEVRAYRSGDEATGPLVKKARSPATTAA